ncbi:hypothetical protein VPH35_086596 [Triticum aestivum]
MLWWLGGVGCWCCSRALSWPRSAESRMDLATRGGGRRVRGGFPLLRSGKWDHPDPGKDGGDPCTRDRGLRSDLGENLLLATAKADDGDAEGIAVKKFKATLCYLQGKP